jgi:hypothetical protein
MLTRDIIVMAFTKLSDELGRRGVLGELNVVKGATMVLAFNARASTKDVDAIFEPSADVREAAAVVARNLQLPADWLNDAVKGFLSPTGEFARVPSIDLPNLRVQAPTPEYMLAMKVLAARTGAGSEKGDADDIAFLIELLGLTNADSVLDIARRYYDPSRILPRSVYLVDEIFEELNKR